MRCAPASLYQQEAGKKLEERIDVESKLEYMDRKLDRLLEAIQPTQPGRRATGRAQEVEDSEWIELFRFCECEDDPNSRLDVDDEDDNLEPIEERELRKGKKLLPQDGASRLADISNLKVFFGNLHSHTRYSDGTSKPKDAFEHARDEGNLDFLAVTPHNHKSANKDQSMGVAFDHERYTGPRSDGLIPVANSLTVDDEFVALYGQEVSSISKGNHVIVLDVPKVVDADDVPNGRFDKLLNTWLPSNLDTEGEQAVVQLNHPWSGSSDNDIEYGRDDFGSFEEWPR